MESEWDKTFEALKPGANDIDFLLTPYVLERCILFGMLVSAESFLYFVAVVPLRALYFCVASLLRGGKPTPFAAKADVARVALVAVALAAVWNLDLASLAKLVKLSEIKLKMVWMSLEFLDKVLVSWGASVYGSLLWVLRRPPAAAASRWSLRTHFLVAAGLLSLHCTLLLVHLSVLNVAVGSGSTTLLSLVVLVQFAEMKGSSQKSIDRRKLAEMVNDDISERFQLLVFVFTLFVHNIKGGAAVSLLFSAWGNDGDGENNVLLMLLILYTSELVVDVLKHTAVSNTNKVPPGFYLKHLNSLAAASQASEAWRVSPFAGDECHSLARRVGLAPLPLTVVLIKICKDSLAIHSPLKIAAVFAVAWAVALCLRICLRTVLRVCSHMTPFSRVDKWLGISSEDK